MLRISPASFHDFFPALSFLFEHKNEPLSGKLCFSLVFASAESFSLERVVATEKEVWAQGCMILSAGLALSLICDGFPKARTIPKPRFSCLEDKEFALGDHSCIPLFS